MRVSRTVLHQVPPFVNRAALHFGLRPCLDRLRQTPVTVRDDQHRALETASLEIREEIQARQAEADQIRDKAVQRVEIEADQAQRRFMRVDPSNRLVADTLEADWNDKLRELAKVREERERSRVQNPIVVDDVIHERLVAMTTDFKQLWADPVTPSRERKRMLAHLIEDVTLVKRSREGITKIHVRFKGGKTETLTTLNPKSSAQKVKTSPKVVDLVDKLLDDHIYSEIADLLNEKGLRPGGSAWPGRDKASFDSKRVAYLVNTYKLRSRYDRLRERGMLTRREMANKLGIHEQTVARWAEYGIVTPHAYNGHRYLYEPPGSDPPVKQCSRWNPLAHRAKAIQPRANEPQLAHMEPEEV